MLKNASSLFEWFRDKGKIVVNFVQVYKCFVESVSKLSRSSSWSFAESNYGGVLMRAPQYACAHHAGRVFSHLLIYGCWYFDDEECWVMIEADQPSGSTHLLEEDQATGSTHLWAHMSCLDCTSVGQARPIIWTRLNSLTLLSLYLPRRKTHDSILKNVNRWCCGKAERFSSI